MKCGTLSCKGKAWMIAWASTMFFTGFSTHKLFLCDGAAHVREHLWLHLTEGELHHPARMQHEHKFSR